VRSADVTTVATAAATLLLAGALDGCVQTTQEKNARAGLQSERLVAARSSVRVTRSDPEIRVLGVALLRSRAGTAVAVTLRNDAGRSASDLPVSVGVRTRSGRVRYLNRGPELPYFQTHIAGVAAGASATWVFTTRRRAPSGQPFARVGVPTIGVPGRSGAGVPAIAASRTTLAAVGRGGASAATRLSNHSGVDQSALQAYAFALSPGGRLVAAGTASVGDLASGASKDVRIALLGSPGTTPVQIDAPPTNLQ
jgi:hypothetical protein